MTPQVREALDELRRDADASSYVEVIRRALALYHRLNQEKRQGRLVITRPAEGEDGTEREILFY
ncbi:MAG: hypothetical protein AAGB26_16405 [Planctomycetota bacterium]